MILYSTFWEKLFFSYLFIFLPIVFIGCVNENLSTIRNKYTSNSIDSHIKPTTTNGINTSSHVNVYLSDSGFIKSSNLIYINDFDELVCIPADPLNQNSDLINESSRSSAITLSNSIIRSGKRAVRFEYLKNDAELFNLNNQNAYLYQRAELARPSELEAEQWYGFSNYFPSSYVPDPIPELVFQWHDLPDWSLGENWRSPPLALITTNNRFLFKVRYSNEKLNTNTTATQIDFDLDTVIKDEWIDWVVHVKFSYGPDGILEVWKNGMKVINYVGPNSYNDAKLPYFKFGIYKWDWTESPETRNQSHHSGRIIYYDALKVGNHHASYKEVSPD